MRRFTFLVVKEEDPAICDCNYSNDAKWSTVTHVVGGLSNLDLPIFESMFTLRKHVHDVLFKFFLMRWSRSLTAASNDVIFQNQQIQGSGGEWLASSALRALGHRVLWWWGRALARREQIGSHAESDCHIRPSGIVYNSTVVGEVGGFLTRNLDHWLTTNGWSGFAKTNNIHTVLPEFRHS